jgi:hypothetical protein
VKPLALLFPLALCVTVAVELARTVPDVLETPFAAATGAPPQPVRVPAVRMGAGQIVREQTFHSDNLQALALANEIRLTLGTFDSSPSLSSGELRLASTGCVFTTTPGRIENAAQRTFERSGGCGNVPAASGSVTLTVTLDAGSPRQGQLAVWAGDTTGEAALVLVQDGVRRVPSGSIVTQRSTARVPRMALLAFMWERPASHLWTILAFAGALLIAGSAGIAFSSHSSGTSSASSPHPQRQFPPPPASASRTRLRGSYGGQALSVSFAAAALAGGLALAYSVIIPPFQAPDEPDHLLSFTQFTGRQDLAASASELARRVHFERMAFHPDERFRPADRDTPFAQAWDPNTVFPHDISTRSSSAAAFWRLTAALVPSPASRAVLALRLMNALVFALAFGCAAVIVARSAGAGTAAAAIVPILTIPTLAFFGMHVSELTWPIVGFVLLGAAVISLFAACTTGVEAGLAIGLSAALFAAGPRSAWPMAPMLAAVLAGRVLLQPAAALRETALFWAAVAAPVLVLFGIGVLFVPGQLYEQWRFEGFQPARGASNLAVAGGALVVAVFGLGLERLWTTFAARVWGARWITGAVRGLAGAAALAVAGVAAASLFVALPHVPKIHLWTGSAREFVTHVTTTVLTAGRLADLDLLTWTSFMGTFGWIDTLLPDGLNVAVTAMWALAVVALLLWVMRKGDAVRGVWVGLVAAGFIAVVAVSAASLFGMGRSLQGRYLLGGYTVVLMLAGSAPALMLGAAHINRWTLALVGGIAVVHGITITVLLHRYFA